jgi:general secretion pathway protein G
MMERRNSIMKRKNNTNLGFTLVEMMAVLLIIALLAGLAGTAFLGQIDKAKKKATQADLVTLRNAVTMFKMDTGFYPSEEVGLIELIEQPMDLEGWAEGGYLEETTLPEDGWGNDFVYLLEPGDGKPFVIISYGADGKEGGDGNDTDLTSNNLEGTSDVDMGAEPEVF